MPDEKEGNRGAIEFLIAEFNEISQETRRLRQEGVARLNFFVTITSSILGVLIFLSQGKTTSGSSLQVAAIGLLFLILLVGLDTFNFLISRDVSTDLNIRATGRIRRFFSTQSPEIQKYLTWRCNDEPTPWITNNNSGVRRTIQYILSSVCTLITYLASNLASANFPMTAVVSVFTFLGSLTAFHHYSTKRFRKAVISAQKSMRFPELPDQEKES
jgi:hypothetical protein